MKSMICRKNADQYAPVVDLLVGASQDLGARQKAINRSLDELGLHFEDATDGDDFDPGASTFFRWC